MTTLLLTALCILPHSREPVEERVDCIERNHFHAEDGRLVFTQDIFWACDLPYPNRVLAWRMADKTGVPYRDGEDWVLLWTDADVLRLVRSTSFVETWEQFDPEVAARETLPPEHRRGLRGEKPVTSVDR